MATWVITYRGTDRVERRMETDALEKPSPQTAAMLVSNVLKQENRAAAPGMNTALHVAEHYNFAIVDIRPQ